MGNRNLVLLGAAIIIGLFAVILANSYFSGVETQQERVAAEQRLARIVVASQPLQFGQPLTAQNLRLQNFPQASVPQGAFRTIEEAMRGGRVALRPIVPGEPVLRDKVSGTDGRAVLAANLAEGMRAVSIPVNATTGVSGFVRPGDTVDVLLTRGLGDNDYMTDVILERVKVLAIDQVANEQETDPKVGKTAVLEVDQYGAQKLALADQLGTLSLALRNVQNQLPGPATTVTARDLGGYAMFRSARARPAQPAGMFAPRVPDFPNVAFAQPPAAAGGGAAVSAPRPSGPTMTIYRGVEPTEESVGRLGGS
jgi:pilus assembly protein CpaB